MKDLKIIFTGPVGSGKTTAITTLSDIATIRTDKHASDMTQSRKAETTVAMDYGVMILNGKEKIHLYGTPGQERFDFMWEILTYNGIGLILLLDNTRKNPLNDMDFFLKSFEQYINKTAVSIGITRTDITPLTTLDKYQKKLDELGFKGAIFEVDARNFEDMSNLTQALLFTLDPELECST